MVSEKKRIAESQVFYVDERLPSEPGVYMTNAGPLYYSGSDWQSIEVEEGEPRVLVYWLGPHFLVN